MVKFIEKEFQTAPVNAVTEPSLASGSDVNVPTIKAVLDGLRSKQLLLNNDFQVNQRGKTLYDDFGYTLDMWYFYGVIGNGTTKPKIEVKDKGIKITNTDYNWCSIQQVVQDNLRGKTVTICFKVSDLQSNQNTQIDYPMNVRMCYGNTTGEVTSQNSYGIKAVYEDGIYSATIDIPQNTIHNKLKLVFMVGGSATIEYIDLFEGEVAYPHSSQSYIRDFLECQRYLKRIVLNWAGYITTGSMQQTFLFETPMISNPTVLVRPGTKVINNVNYSASKDRFVWILGNSTAGNGYAYDYIYTLSCEPI